MHVFVSVSWHTSAALMGSNSKTTNVQCTLSEGSLDLLWRAETPPHKRVCEYFPITAFGLLSTLGGCLLFVAAGPFRAGCTTTQKDQARKKPGLVRLGDLQPDQRLQLPGALRNSKTYCSYSTGIEYSRKHSITVHEHKVVERSLHLSLEPSFWTIALIGYQCCC
jgi:hypothetical protein